MEMGTGYEATITVSNIRCVLCCFPASAHHCSALVFPAESPALPQRLLKGGQCTHVEVVHTTQTL